LCLPPFPGNSETADSRVEWSSVDDEGIQLDEYSLRPKDPPTDQFGEPDDEPHEYSLAVTGEVFRWMVDFAPVDTFQRVRSASLLLS
jgi:cation-transporting ATPase 13A2